MKAKLIFMNTLPTKIIIVRKHLMQLYAQE